MKIGDLCPRLADLQRQMASRTVHSEDIPAAYLQFMLGEPMDIIVTSRVDDISRSFTEQNSRFSEFTQSKTRL